MTQEFDEAIGRARGHLRRATLEGLEAATALLQAASSVSGSNPTAGGLSADLLSGIDRVLRELRSEGRFAFPESVTGPVEEALAREIKRWEQRSKSDPDARPVLRAFLGLRELLWELGMRSDEPATKRPASSPRSADTASNGKPAPERGTPRASRRRVQRFDVEE